MRIMNVKYDFISEDQKPSDISSVDREVLELARIMYVNKIKKIELIIDIEEKKEEIKKEEIKKEEIKKE